MKRSRTSRLALLLAVSVSFLMMLLLFGCESGASTGITVTPNSGPSSQFFSGLSGDGYSAYKMYGVKEGETMVILVGVRVAPGNDRSTYDAIYEHATTLAKQYGIAVSEGELLRVVLVEATTEQKIIESRDFDLTGGEG